MINYGDGKACFVSFGLSISKENWPAPLTDDVTAMLGVMKEILQQSDFFADSELLKVKAGEVQALDIGDTIYVRRLIDSDQLAAFMSAKDGEIRIKNRDGVMKFSMDGFDETISKLFGTCCD